MMRPPTIQFINEWIEVLVKDEKIWDQNAFNDLFRRGLINQPEDPEHVFLAYDGTLRTGILPVSLFCSGHTFFVQRMPKTLGLKPYVVHATFQFSGTPGKRHRLREARLWNDPPKYYDPPNGVLTFDLDIPEDLLASSAPNSTTLIDISTVQGHFRLVNHQLKQVRYHIDMHHKFILSTPIHTAEGRTSEYLKHTPNLHSYLDRQQTKGGHGPGIA